MSAQRGWSYGDRFVFTESGSSIRPCHGSPENVEVGSVGDWAFDLDAGVIYYKATGTATNTGWEAVGGGGPSLWTQAAGVLSPTTATDVVRAPRDVARTTTTGNVALTDASPRYQVLVLDADRDCTLPSPTTNMAFTIKHAGASYTLTVKDASGVTLALVAASESVTCLYDGTDWQVL